MSLAAVVAVCSDKGHNFSKLVQPSITLLKGKGVEGDAHVGRTVQHLSDKRRDPSAPNLRQVHLMHAELFEELSGQGMAVKAGEMGENIVTQGLDILSLPLGAILTFTSGAQVKVTGLRSPCKKLNTLHDGLLKALAMKTPDGTVLIKAGIMSVVLEGGEIKAGDAISVTLPEGEPVPLKPL